MGSSDRFTTDDAVDLYGLDRWGGGYLAVGSDGRLRVRPGEPDGPFIDVPEVIETIRQRQMSPPVLLRFPQLLAAQVERLTGAFRSAITEYGYPATYHPVFPVKVNQQRTVVEGLLQAGWSHALGLEVGSLAELMAASVLPLPDGAVMVCNGFKDRRYLELAGLAAELGKEVITVIEKPSEVAPIVEAVAGAERAPWVGVRIRLQARGTGLWETSSGVASKFGLSTGELLEAVQALAAAGLRDRLALLHFHIGSQLTEIRHLKAAVREAARVYAKLVQEGVALRYLDVGGGLGVDYDGSRTSSDASVNYTVQEYANDVVYGILEVCREEEVEPPRIISESGRMLTAYHAMLVVDARTSTGGPDESMNVAGDGADGGAAGSGGGTGVGDETPQVIHDLEHTAAHITVKNYREYFHDAQEYRDQMQSAFSLGLLSLAERARGERLYREIARKTVRFSKSAKFIAEEFIELEKTLHEKYVCNFSVFQSLPDHWALDQIFPVVPLHRLNERPTRRAVLVDITCDSLGAVDKFADLKDVKEALEVHPLRPGEPYLLGFLLIGAYQDAIGDMHNLMGAVHEVDVTVGADGGVSIRDARPGQSAAAVLGAFGYGPGLIDERLRSILQARVSDGTLTAGRAEALSRLFRTRLDGYTYME